MSEPGDKLTRAYRDLAREEPPPALDRAILAASQRALHRPSLARESKTPNFLAQPDGRVRAARAPPDPAASRVGVLHGAVGEPQREPVGRNGR